MDNLPIHNTDSFSGRTQENEVRKILIFILLIPISNLTITSNFFKQNTFQNFKN